jgi:hypothetical protein
MPYKWLIEKKKLPRSLDRRVKLKQSDKEKILALYKIEQLAIREIARRYEGICSRKMIQYIIFPERLKLANEQYKERRKDGRYYKKEVNTKAVRETRRYKQINKDKLI